MDSSSKFSFDPAKLSKAAAAEYSTSDSDSDEENNGYRMPATDPTAGEFSEFHPRKRRRTGRNGKESAAMGIFGSDSEDEGTGGRRWQRKQLRKQGVSFVSSGTAKKQADSDEDEDDEDDTSGQQAAQPQDSEDEDYDDESADGVGLGFEAAGGQGPGFVSGSPTARAGVAATSAFTSHKPLVFSSGGDSGFSAQNPLGQGFVPSSAYDPVLKEEVSQRKPTPAAPARPSAFSSAGGGGRGKGGGAGSGGGFNPKSFGARMMAKMGYVEGSGLGAAGQGRNIIIEANLRPQGAGLGAVKEKSEKERQEEKRQARLRGEVVVDSDEEEKKARAAAAEAKRRRRQAIGGGSGTPSSGVSTPRRGKSKAKFATLEEARRAAPGLQIPDAFSPILDMTGRERRLLTSASGLMTPTGGSPGAATPGGSGGAGEETAEQAAQRKLARRAQNDFMAILEEWQNLQNRKAYAELQAQQEQQEIEELEGILRGHRAMTEAFAQLALVSPANGATSWQDTWQRTVAQLKAAAEAIPAASVRDMRDELANISVAALHPLFGQALAAWDPLTDTNAGLAEDLRSLWQLLGVRGSGKDDDGAVSKTASAYETMMYKVWLPQVARAVRRWDAQADPESMLSLYETWKPVLPEFVREQLLERDIVRRLEDAVARWEPKRRRHHGDGKNKSSSSSSSSQSLPHLWLFPWLPHLPGRHLDPRSADGLVVEVKRKFRQLVDVWEFYRGVVPGLQQWRAVLRPSADNDQWRPLVMAHVLPSMARYVRAQFRVDAGDQAAYLEVITGEFQWLASGLVAPELLGEVMVAEVFPLWHAALYELLTSETTATSSSSLALAQLAQWLGWWTADVFPEAIRRQPSVAAEFAAGLAMVNEALDLGFGDPARQAAVAAGLSRPRKGPAATTGDRHGRHRDHHHHHHHGDHHGHRTHGQRDDERAAAAAGGADAAADAEDMSIRHYVEAWCEDNDVQFVPERKKVHAAGPLYRITARGDGRGGVLVYFKGLRLYAETKRGPVEMRVDREEDWSKLLEMAQ